MSLTGLIGAHRTGKTTLARLVAERSGMEYLPLNVSSVIRDNQVDLSKSMTFTERLTIQHKILDHSHKIWDDVRMVGTVICDRSPIDMMGYLLCDIGPQDADSDFKQLEEYLSKCFELTNEFFTMLILVQPGIDLIIDPSKETAPLNKSYIEHLNATIKGLMMDSRLMSSAFFLNEQCLDLDERQASVKNLIDRQMEILFLQSQGDTLH